MPPAQRMDAAATPPRGPDPEESGSTGSHAIPGTGRNLPVAIASGVLLAAIVIATLAWSPLAFIFFVSVLLVVALLELDIGFRATGLRPATPVTVGAGLVMLFGAYAVGPAGQTLGLVLLGSGAVLWALLGTWRQPFVATIGATMLMGAWVPFMASFLPLLIVRENGEWLVLATVALTVTNDIGAYAFGSAFGRTKLAPRVSPGKTWEGFAGGLLTVLVIAALITAQLPGFDLWTALALGLVVVPAATLGDLSESLVKRDLGVKDLGRIMPGHGGIMDRVDAIVFALPAAHFLLLALGV